MSLLLCMKFFIFAQYYKILYSLLLGTNCSLFTTEVKSATPREPEDLKKHSVPMEKASKYFKFVSIEDYKVDNFRPVCYWITLTGVLKQLNSTVCIDAIMEGTSNVDISLYFYLPFLLVKYI